ncbi:uncharacterized protein LOC118478137 [Aplysia californica]|uniref:Uncharacterized protein LOC118478137 n=1 Tax=Aplysia californica TaxID=6500 RepID=A0ABM1VX42_APLCA|nr:uncharacterized protein LOC118478137 [Aplysia californica]
MERTRERHYVFVHELCRICGSLHTTRKDKSSYKKPKLCKDMSRDILFVFGIDTKTDNPDIHSQFLCRKCARKLLQVKKAESGQSLQMAREIEGKAREVWCQFSEENTTSNCSLCAHRLSLGNGCIKTKKEVIDRDEDELDPGDETPFSNEDDSLRLQFSEIPIATSTPLKNRTADTATSPVTPRQETLLDSLRKPVSEPLSKKEELLLTHFVKRKLFQDPNHSTFSCKTKGQPLVLQKTLVPRKKSSAAKTPTKRRRARWLSEARMKMSGKSPEALDKQFASELKTVPMCRRQVIYNKTKGAQHLKLTKQQTLCMSEALGLSWR